MRCTVEHQYELGWLSYERERRGAGKGRTIEEKETDTRKESERRLVLLLPPGPKTKGGLR